MSTQNQRDSRMTDFKKTSFALSHGEQILTVTLDAPKANVLDQQMMTEIIQIVSDKATNPTVKALVFQGEGPHFSFGASVQEHQKEFVADMLKLFHKMMRLLIETSKPMFALVRGNCLGGGLELAALCHWIFASEDAMFGQPEINLAVFPPVASLILPHRIGQSHADDLVVSGRTIDAQTALRMGLVHTVSAQPDSDLEAFISKHILPKSRTALEFAARTSRYEMTQAFLRHIEELEKIYVEELMQTDDANEGIRAFLEKRKPVWQEG